MVIEMLLEFMKQSVLGRAWSHRMVGLTSATRGLNQVVEKTGQPPTCPLDSL